ncbi:hypothetical protein Hdeb2414_s0008g00290171 [Helianthus debilis subsp. tardiflorus]
MKPNTDAIDTQTIFLADQDLLVELEAGVDDGPLACGTCLPGGWLAGVCLGDGKKGVPDPVDVVVFGDAGGAGLVVAFNGFPSLLKSGMVSSLSGMGPLNRGYGVEAVMMRH